MVYCVKYKALSLLESSMEILYDNFRGVMLRA